MNKLLLNLLVIEHVSYSQCFTARKKTIQCLKPKFKTVL